MKTGTMLGSGNAITGLPTTFKQPYASPPGCLVCEAIGLGGLAVFLTHLVPWIALILAVVGVGVLFAGVITEARTVLVCSITGYAIRRRTRFGVRSHRAYRWSDVTATDYREAVRSGSLGGEHVGFLTFQVTTADGRTFDILSNMRCFDRCIALFNEMTPQLPYTWVKRKNYGIGRYAKVTRIGPADLAKELAHPPPQDGG